MLCGVGIGTVRTGLLASGITLRSNRPSQPMEATPLPTNLTLFTYLTLGCRKA